MLYCLYYAPTSYYPNSNFASPGGNSTMNLFVDINGLRKPNVLGRDMFVLAVGYHTGLLFRLMDKLFIKIMRKMELVEVSLLNIKKVV